MISIKDRQSMAHDVKQECAGKATTNRHQEVEQE